MRDLTAASTPVGEAVMIELHRQIVARIDPVIAGIYSRHRRRISGGISKSY